MAAAHNTLQSSDLPGFPSLPEPAALTWPRRRADHLNEVFGRCDMARWLLSVMLGLAVGAQIGLIINPVLA